VNVPYTSDIIHATNVYHVFIIDCRGYFTLYNIILLKTMQDALICNWLMLEMDVFTY